MFARSHYVDGTTTVPREVGVKNIYLAANRREEKRRKIIINVNLNQENSLLFSTEVIPDAPFALVMKGFDHSDRLFMMISFMSCVFKCFASCFLRLSSFHFPLLGRFLLLSFSRLPILFQHLLPCYLFPPRLLSNSVCLGIW